MLVCGREEWTDGGGVSEREGGEEEDGWKGRGKGRKGRSGGREGER